MGVETQTMINFMTGKIWNFLKGFDAANKVTLIPKMIEEFTGMQKKQIGKVIASNSKN